MLDYLGMRVRQECCEFEGLQVRVEDPPEHLCNEWAPGCVCVVVLQLQPPTGSKKLWTAMDYLGMRVGQVL
jgi:hypothetical protein